MWDEVAIFSLNIVDMGVHKVQIGVYDKDMGFIHDDGLGFAEVDLAEVDRATGEHPRQSFKLEARDKDGPTACGEIHARVMLFPILTDMSSTRLRFADVKVRAAISVFTTSGLAVRSAAIPRILFKLTPALRMLVRPCAAS